MRFFLKTIFILLVCISFTTCTKKDADNINKQISDNIAKGAQDVRLTFDILGFLALEKTEDATGEVECLHDAYYTAFLSDGHIVNIDGEQRENVNDEYLKEVVKIASYYNATNNYDSHYTIRDGKILVYDVEEFKNETETKPQDILNIVSLENDTLVVYSEDEKITLTLRKIFDWTIFNQESPEVEEENINLETKSSTEEALEEVKELYTTDTEQ